MLIIIKLLKTLRKLCLTVGSVVQLAEESRADYFLVLNIYSSHKYFQNYEDTVIAGLKILNESSAVDTNTPGICGWKCSSLTFFCPKCKNNN